MLFAPRELPPLRPNVAEDAGRYDAWVRASEAARSKTLDPPQSGRSLRVAMVVDGPPPPETMESLQSLRSQRSGSVNLAVVLLSRWRQEMSALLKESDLPFASHLVLLDEGSTSFQLLQRALEEADDHGVAPIYPGDVWAPDAVFKLSAALEHHGVVYADEDSIDSGGVYGRPRLKPDFSPEFLLHADYIGRPLALSAEVVARLPEPAARSLGARNHDLALRACEMADSVHHVAEVLCHRHVQSLSSSIEDVDDWGHVQSAIARRRERGSARRGVAAATARIIRTPEVRSASVIIPFRDEPQLLRACFDSIERTRKDVAVEYLLVDNGSDQPETATLLERLGERPDVSILRDDRPFNWAQLNNAAVAHASGDVLVFLNNDIEAMTHGWLDALCAQVERPEIGAAGARLLYPSRRLQHCGVVLGLGGAAGHLFVGLAEDHPGYLDMAVTTRECSAVTGACLATRRSLFEDLGGFDETLGVDLNDIDYCLRVWGSGRRVVYESSAELVHYESPSRGTAGAVGDIIRFVERWKGSILAGDPYLNPHLTRVDSSCALRDPGEPMWWQQWYVGLSRTTG